MNFKKITLRKDKTEQKLETFQTLHYQNHNIARLSHLDSLGLDLRNKTVLEFGAGIGDHTIFYLHRNCKVFPTDARKELLDIIEKRFDIKTMKIDAETDLNKISNLPNVDIVHCYGLLYHISNPDKFIESISNKSELLLLETCVSWDSTEISAHITKEDKNDPTQAVSGLGCRPNRKWIEKELKKHYGFVYYPITQPNHEQFPLDWKNEDQSLILKRSIFIASKNPLQNDLLTTELPVLYKEFCQFKG